MATTRVILFTDNQNVTAAIVLFDDPDGAIVRHAAEPGVRYERAYAIDPVGGGDGLLAVAAVGAELDVNDMITHALCEGGGFWSPEAATE